MLVFSGQHLQGRAGEGESVKTELNEGVGRRNNRVLRLTVALVRSCNVAIPSPVHLQSVVSILEEYSGKVALRLRTGSKFSNNFRRQNIGFLIHHSAESSEESDIYPGRG